MNYSTETSLFDVLDHQHQEFIHYIADKYHLTHQNIRELCETAVDLLQWEDVSLIEWWRQEEVKYRQLDIPEAKKKIISALRSWIDGKRNEPTQYGNGNGHNIPREALQLTLKEMDKTIYGMCPVASNDTVCCQLRTIDAVENCGFNCSYCTIQTFYGNQITFDKNLRQKLKAISLESSRLYHFGTGQSSDSLMWGNHNNLFDDLSDFAHDNPNVILELKTKSDNVSYFLIYKVPRNMFISWSLNTETIIAHEEHGTAPLQRRLSAAKKVADWGMPVGFHFHPLVYYQGWQEDYSQLAKTVMEQFDPRKVLFVSLGTLTFIKPVIKQIRQRGDSTKILQMPMATDPKGKITYPDAIKIEMFNHMLESFKPWRDKVFMYLCMEKADIWKETLGNSYSNNEDFEADFCRCMMEKISGDGSK